jgi:hypothetical protein
VGCVLVMVCSLEWLAVANGMGGTWGQNALTIR